MSAQTWTVAEAKAKFSELIDKAKAKGTAKNHQTRSHDGGDRCGGGMGNLEIADACGRLVARGESLGRPMEPRDAFIAATVQVHALTLVTRNASDFEATVKTIVTPWS